MCARISLFEILFRLIFNEPYSSIAAKLVAIVSVFFICASIFSFCIKTHPYMRVPEIRNRTSGHGAWFLEKYRTEPYQIFFYIER